MTKFNKSYEEIVVGFKKHTRANTERTKRNERKETKENSEELTVLRIEQKSKAGGPRRTREWKEGKAKNSIKKI